MKLYIIFACTCGLVQLSAEKLDKLSFSPPFETHDRAGGRIVSHGWTIDGVTKIAKNFVRLTPDRASKRGSLWSKFPLGISEATIIVEFRISGKTKKLFGDGLAIWVVEPYKKHDTLWDDDFYYRGMDYFDDGDNPYHSWNEWPLGDFHGFEPKFKGIGIIFDTYVNADMPKHKDVTVVVNDRNQTEIHPLIESSTGCASMVRWYEERDDFHAGKASSKAKISIVGNELNVLVDANGSGKWYQCVKIPLPLEENWLKEAHIGATASTGELADNHDVIRIEVYSDDNSANVGEAERARIGLGSLDSNVQTEKKGEGERKEALPVDEMSIQDRMSRLETYLNVLLVKLDLVEHHMEHELISLEQSTSESALALRSQEHLLEMHLKNLAQKVALAEDRLQQVVDNGLMTASRNALGWRMPVAFLAFFLLGCAVAAMMGWRKLRKTHLL